MKKTTKKLPSKASPVTNDAVLHVSSTLPAFPYVTVIDNQTGDSVIEQ